MNKKAVIKARPGMTTVREAEERFGVAVGVAVTDALTILFVVGDGIFNPVKTIEEGITVELVGQASRSVVNSFFASASSVALKVAFIRGSSKPATWSSTCFFKQGLQMSIFAGLK